MRLLFVHAHYDDFELTAAGTFLKWVPRADSSELRKRVIVCTDGAAGHHRMPREHTAARRWAEQNRAAELGGFEVTTPTDSSGRRFREGGLRLATDFRAALWKAIRDFEPDYLFCPPLSDDPLAGIHVDHLDVAEAVRGLAYLINVPHAFSPEFPEEGENVRYIKTPVILNVFDGYMAAGLGHDLAVDIEDVVDRVAEMAWCHESQLKEWLPWVDRHHLGVPSDSETWAGQMRELLRRRAKSLGVEGRRAMEFFTVTAWGSLPTLAQLVQDFPAIYVPGSRLDALGTRLALWRSAMGG